MTQKKAKFEDVAVLLVDSHYGIYSGQALAERIPADRWLTLKPEDHATLLAGPDQEEPETYWDVLSDLETRGEQFLGTDGQHYVVAQIEDIWAIPADVEVTNWEELQ